jgi:hypothetical protein
MITAVFRNSEFATTLFQVLRCIPINTLQQFQFPPKLKFYSIYRFYSLFLPLSRFPVHTRPHNDHIRSVAALVACADNSRTATACSSGMLSTNLRHTLMRTAAAGTSWRLRLLPSRTGPSSFWRRRAKPTTKLCIFYEKIMNRVQG